MYGGSIPFALRPASLGGTMVLDWENRWVRAGAHGTTLSLRGDARTYLSYRPLSTDWSGVRYDKLRLLGKSVRRCGWTVDVSRT